MAGLPQVWIGLIDFGSNGFLAPNSFIIDHWRWKTPHTIEIYIYNIQTTTCLTYLTNFCIGCVFFLFGTRTWFSAFSQTWDAPPAAPQPMSLPSWQVQASVLRRFSMITTCLTYLTNFCIGCVFFLFGTRTWFSAFSQTWDAPPAAPQPMSLPSWQVQASVLRRFSMIVLIPHESILIHPNLYKF